MSNNVGFFNIDRTLTVLHSTADLAYVDADADDESENDDLNENESEDNLIVLPNGGVKQEIKLEVQDPLSQERYESGTDLSLKDQFFLDLTRMPLYLQDELQRSSSKMRKYDNNAHFYYHLYNSHYIYIYAAKV